MDNTPCKYTLKGVKDTLSFDQFCQFLTANYSQKELEELADQTKIVATQKPSNLSATDVDKKLRGVIAAFIERSDLPDDVKQGLLDDPDSYIKELSYEEVNTLVDEVFDEMGGIESVVDNIKDFASLFPLDTITTAYGKALVFARNKTQTARTKEDREYWSEKEKELQKTMATLGTSAGRAIQQLYSFYALSAYAYIKTVREEMAARNKVFGKAVEPLVNKVGEILKSREYDAEGWQSAEKGGLDNQIAAINKSIEKKERQLAEAKKEPTQSRGKLKIIVSKERASEAVKNILSFAKKSSGQQSREDQSVIPAEIKNELIDAAASVLQQGFFSYEDFYKKMSKILGGAIEDHYADAYNIAVERYIEAGVNGKFFDTTDRVDEVDSEIAGRKERLEREIREAKEKAKILSLSKSLSLMMSQPATTKEAAESKADKMASIAAQIDEYFGGDSYSNLVADYNMVSEEQKASDKLDRDIAKFAKLTSGETTQTGSKKEKNAALELAKSIDKALGGNTFVESVKAMSAAKKMSALESLMQEKTDDGTTGETKAEKLSRLASEIDAETGNKNASKIVRDFLKSKDDAAISKKAEAFIERISKVKDSSSKEQSDRDMEQAKELDKLLSTNKYTEALQHIREAKNKAVINKKADAFLEGLKDKARIQPAGSKTDKDLERAKELDDLLSTTLFTDALSAKRDFKKTAEIKEESDLFLSRMAKGPSPKVSSGVDKDMEAAKELDALLSTTSHVDALNAKREATKAASLIASMQPSKQKQKGVEKPERLRAIAAELGGSFPSMVEAYIKQKEEADKLKRVSVETPTLAAMLAKTKGKNQNEELRKIAAELDAKNGTDIHSKRVEAYINSNKTPNQVVSDALIRSGFGKTIKRNGEDVEVVDWEKVVADSPSHEAVVKKIKEIVTKDNPSIDKAVIDKMGDEALSIIEERKAGILNSKLRGLRSLVSKDQRANRRNRIEQLIFLSKTGMLNNKDIMRHMAREFGLVEFTPEQNAEIDRMMDEINATSHGGEREKLEEAFFAYVHYLQHPTFSSKAFFDINKLRLITGPATAVKNILSGAEILAMMPYDIAATQLTGKKSLDINALKVIGKSLPKAATIFSDIMFKGGVDSGLSQAFFAGTKEGTSGVRFSEHWRSDFRDYNRARKSMVYAYKIWDLVFGRIPSAFDSFFHVIAQEQAAYRISKQIAAKALPGASAKEQARQAWKITYGVLMQDAVIQAMQEFKDRGIDISEKSVRFKRRVQEIIEQSRPKEVIEKSLRKAAVDTYKQKDMGVATVVASAVSEAAKVFDRAVLYLKKQENLFLYKLADVVDFVGKAVTTLLVPFINLLGNVTEKGLEMFPAYGLVKGGVYAAGRAAKVDGIDNYRAASYFYRAMVGYVAFQVLKYLADDDKEGLKMIYGEGPQDTQQRSNQAKIRVPNSVTINGHTYGLDYAGPFAVAFKLQASIMDSDREDYVGEKDWRFYTGILAEVASKTYTESSMRLIRELSSENRSEGAIKNIGAEFLTRSLIPITGAVRQVSQMAYPKAMKAITFEEKLYRYAGLSIFLDKPAFDLLGNEYEAGDINANGASGLVKSVMETKKDDEEMLFIMLHNPAIKDVSWSEFNSKIELAEGQPRNLTEEEFYELSRSQAKNFGTLIRAYVKSNPYDNQDLKDDLTILKRGNDDLRAEDMGITPAQLEEARKEVIEASRGKEMTSEERDKAMLERAYKNHLDRYINKEISNLMSLSKDKAIYDYFTSHGMRVPLTMEDLKESDPYTEKLEELNSENVGFKFDGKVGYTEKF